MSTLDTAEGEVCELSNWGKLMRKYGRPKTKLGPFMLFATNDGKETVLYNTLTDQIG